MVKIVRNKSIGQMCRDENGNREWKNTSLHNYLNNDYYNTVSKDYKPMISSTKYYLGGSTTNTNLGADIYYGYERGDQVNGENNISWIGKIGLIYPSDYVYNFALEIDDVCYSDGSSCKTDLGGNPSSSWLYLVKKSVGHNMENISTNKAQTMTIYSNGTIVYGFNLQRTFAINPSLYLKSNVKITSGDGTIDNAYKLSM